MFIYIYLYHFLILLFLKHLRYNIEISWFRSYIKKLLSFLCPSCGRGVRAVSISNKFFRNQCTPAEKVELARWIKESAHDATLKEILEDAWKEYEPNQSMSGLKAEAFLAGIFKQEEMTEQTLAARAPVKYIWWKRLSVAAILILVLGAGTYFLVFNLKRMILMNGSADDAEKYLHF